MALLLSASWWIAKGLSVKSALSRFFNREMGTAVVVSIAATILLLLVIVSGKWIHDKIESGAVAGWQSKFVLSRYVASLRQRRTERLASEAAAVERERLYDQIRQSTERVSALEQELAKLKDNPVALRHAITKELRK
jgi:cell shape-determining protein MreC